MSMQDPIADMLTRIRNAQAVAHPVVSMGTSKLKLAIAKVLQEAGYIEKVESDSGVKPQMRIHLKYYANQPVIERLERVSRSSLRVYRGKHALPRVMNGLGIAVISTSQGVMTDRQARARGLGGEVLCLVA